MIEDLIYKAIMQIETVQNRLVKYADSPAVFYQIAPNDKEPGWNSKAMYPRIDYAVDWTADTSRKTAGALLVNVWGTNEAPIEDIAAAVQTELSELFLTEGIETFCVQWDRTDYFEGESDGRVLSNEPKSSGCTLSFNMLAFPKQETENPDVIQAVNNLLKEINPAYIAIGHDELPELWKATDETPAVYVRMLSNSLKKCTYAASWFNAKVGVHVISPGTHARQTALQKIIHSTALRGEALMDSGAPFLIDVGTMNYNTAADMLSDGQMTIAGQYIVSPIPAQSEKLNHIQIEV